MRRRATRTTMLAAVVSLALLSACVDGDEERGDPAPDVPAAASLAEIDRHIDAGQMPDVVGWGLNDLGDVTGRLYELHAIIGLQRTVSVASDEIPPGVIVAQSVEPGVDLDDVDAWTLEVSDGGPVISYDDLPEDVAEYARSLPGFDPSELLIARGDAYKSDAWLFGLDCDAVQDAYRTFLDGRYTTACPGLSWGPAGDRDD